MTPSTADSWRSWKGLLALLSLLLCALLWLNGLLGSLERPSVGNALLLRQQELAVLAEPALPPSLRRPLLGSDPRQQLRRELARQAAAQSDPLPPDQLFTWALLEQRADPQFQPPPRLTPLQQRLLCEQQSSDPSGCGSAALARAALLRLLLLTVAPALLMVVGGVLVLRMLWLLARRRLPQLPPLLGPELTLVDVTLLVAGGFVVLGELVAPLVLSPPLQRVLALLAPGRPDLQQAGLVPALYLGLMLAPLTILTLMLRGLGPAPAAGWLQWRWRPWSSSIRRALAQLLMVLPLVALTGWLLDHLWGDPGGSNPLLEMVLRAPSPLAVVLLAATALVLAPLFEEVLFRGVLLPVLARVWGGAWAVLLSAAFFAVAHLSLGEFLPLFVLGLGLGWLRLASGRLSASVIMHALWNGLTFANLLLLAG
ncbi:MAG: CPBP family intramembrane metalloprotease [Cyanobacteria bacterium K_DeepCast_35m_m2_023]|nr:CPBP family intramembrane metalloprotease [Cyanobacteria bacterium K_DeepCast_35m_m2_023]